MRIVECVPNFSEGRDTSVVEAIARSITSVSGVRVLDSTMDPDHHRSVITFAGAPEPVMEAAFLAVATAAKLIDLDRHSGVHPRFGATDVLPFVPLQAVSMEECVRMAEVVGQRIWNELSIPVYLYEFAARNPERRRLEQVRRELRENPASVPDFGDISSHATAGAIIAGARKVLVAFNVNLNTPDVSVARDIARRIRESSGGLPGVKALGLFLASRNLAQISMNLVDIDVTPVHVVFEAIRREAESAHVEIAGSEFIGLVPKRAVEQAAAYHLKLEQMEFHVLPW